MTESSALYDMDVERIHDSTGRGNSTKYLVKLFNRDDLVWIRGRDMCRRDLVMEFQRAKNKESKLKRHPQAGAAAMSQAPQAFSQPLPEDSHGARPPTISQNPIMTKSQQPKKRKSNNPKKGDLRAYFKQFGADKTKPGVVTGLSVANINTLKAADPKSKVKSKEKQKQIATVASSNTKNQSEREDFQQVLVGPVAEAEVEAQTAFSEAIDLLNVSPEPVVQVDDDIQVDEQHQEQQHQQQDAQEQPPVQSINRCSICKDDNVEYLTSSLCNHALFCQRCIIHLLFAESCSNCELCKNMHSSFLKMVNPLSMHKLLMTCAHFMDLTDQPNDEWRSYLEKKSLENNQFIEALNAFSLSYQQERLRAEQQQLHLAATSLSNLSRFEYTREQLPSIHDQWSQNDDAHKNSNS